MGFLEKWPQLLNTPWLFLLDGFDEIRQERRQEVLGWLKKFVKEGTAFIITSRPTEDLSKELEGQPRFELQAFTPEQQSQLAKRWLGERAGNFEAAFARFANGELGGTPLLLTIAAIVYLNAGELPLRRSELYREFVQSTWKEALSKGGTEELGTEVVINADALIPRCLSLIARTMSEMRGEGPALDFSNDATKLIQVVAKVLVTDLRLSERIAALRGKKLLEFLGTRGGVFRSSSYHFEWLHPTFREYLTAESFAEDQQEREIDDLLARCNDVAWRQVVLFLIAIRSEKELVISIVRRLKSIAPPKGLVLAAIAISEGANVDQSLVQEVVEDLCTAIRKHCKGDLCARLLTTGDMFTLRPALKPFMQMTEVSHSIAKLKCDLVQAAFDFGKDRSCGVEDLRELGASDTLVELASDAKAPISVRADAAQSLCALGSVKEGYKAFLELAALACGETKAWFSLVCSLAKVNDARLLAEVGGRNFVSEDQWGILLDL